VATDDAVKEQVTRFERVEWCYDGLNGKIIPWTLEHGGTSHDPSVQAFVLGADGEVIVRAPDAEVHQARSFARWAKAQADAYELEHPRTRVPFLPAEVEVEEDGDVRSVRCAALEEARAAKRPALLYLGRGEREGQDRRLRAEVEAARRFERSTLDSKKAAEEAAGWVLLRLDLADATQAAFAAGLGVERAPALVLFLPGAEGGQVLRPGLTGAALAYLLRKHRPGD